MRKLKLQMQISVDGFVARQDGALDWMTWDWDDEIKKYVGDLHDSIDTILLGRKMTEGFISHWMSVVEKHDESSKELKENYEFAKKMIDIPKVVFTKSLDTHNWVNTELAKGNIVDEVNQLKKQNGKDIIVYGGAGFVSSLINNNLIDDYYLFINPSVIGKGMTIFSEVTDHFSLKLVKSYTFDCGIVVNHYTPK
ncbi:MAG: dihydrofolate reductase family protein [Ignavibacteriales bacterium]